MCAVTRRCGTVLQGAAGSCVCGLAVTCVAFLSLLAPCLEPAVAQSKLPTQGFVETLGANATGEELDAQPDLWVLEVSFRPMRMMSIEIADPKTGQRKRELVWYLIYKATNRPLTRQEDKSDMKPVNVYDPAPKAMFIPEFVIVTDDNTGQFVYPDEILPEAQAAIARRERLPLKNSVQIVDVLPPMTPHDARKQSPIYGVATWRNVEPKTDDFTVFMGGFSNGYRIGKDPDGAPLALRRTIMIEYWRPGDRFDQNEREIRVRTPPEWMYRPDEPDSEPATTALVR
jgi:hypothetical protein